MSEPKFTKGPWEMEYRCLKPEAYSVIKRGVSKNGHPQINAICHIADGSKFARINTQLIAAAPDLYEALENLVAWASLEETPRLANLISDARAALAKARGEQ